MKNIRASLRRFAANNRSIYIGLISIVSLLVVPIINQLSLWQLEWMWSPRLLSIQLVSLKVSMLFAIGSTAYSLLLMYLASPEGPRYGQQFLIPSRRGNL